jgi:hypothetical protein
MSRTSNSSFAFSVCDEILINHRQQELSNLLRVSYSREDAVFGRLRSCLKSLLPALCEVFNAGGVIFANKDR